MSGATRPGSRRPPVGRTTVRVGLSLALAFAALAASAGYWQVVRSDELVTRPDNPQTAVLRREAVRGLILDRDGAVLADNRFDADGLPYRVYVDDSVSQAVGYAARRYGTAGLERTYDAYLVGLKTGDARTDLLSKFAPDPYDPRDVQTSLSLELQRRAIAELGPDRGAVVMLDPRNGEVLVLASTPTYDASAVADPATSQAAFSALQADSSQPLLPRATQGLYVPGSVFKVVTATSGLRVDAIGRDTRYPEQPPAEKDGLVVDGFRITDSHHPATGSRELDLVDATEVSCNIWYALAGLEMGGAALSSGAAALGFGAPLPFDLPTSVSQVTNGGGPLPGGFADEVELANAAYGQAETLATPLQMALVAATVANDGVLMEPRLATALVDPDGGGSTTLGPSSLGRVMDPADAAVLVEAMTAAVEGELGRQYTSGAKIPGVLTAGKSGTAELGGSGEPHSWFIGFAPADDPTIAIAVLVERGGRGGERAAPLAGRMMSAYFDIVSR